MLADIDQADLHAPPQGGTVAQAGDLHPLERVIDIKDTGEHDSLEIRNPAHPPIERKSI